MRHLPTQPSVKKVSRLSKSQPAAVGIFVSWRLVAIFLGYSRIQLFYLWRGRMAVALLWRMRLGGTFCIFACSSENPVGWRRQQYDTFLVEWSIGPSPWLQAFLCHLCTLWWNWGGGKLFVFLILIAVLEADSLIVVNISFGVAAYFVASAFI